MFWPDWFGGGGLASLRPLLEVLLRTRRDHAFGPQTDYFDDPNLVGWTRAGDAELSQGMAVVLSDGGGGSKRMASADRTPPSPT